MVECIEEVEENNAEEPNKNKYIVNTNGNAFGPFLYSSHKNHRVENHDIDEQDPRKDGVINPVL